MDQTCSVGTDSRCMVLLDPYHVLAQENDTLFHLNLNSVQLKIVPQRLPDVMLMSLLRDSLFIFWRESVLILVGGFTDHYSEEITIHYC